MIAILVRTIVIFVASVPLYFIWNFLAPIYFTFLPDVWHNIPFWHVVLLCTFLYLVSVIALPHIIQPKEK